MIMTAAAAMVVGVGGDGDGLAGYGWTAFSPPPGYLGQYFSRCISFGWLPGRPCYTSREEEMRWTKKKHSRPHQEWTSPRQSCKRYLARLGNGRAHSH